VTRSQAIAWSVVAWVAVWAFWLTTTRGYHATWPLATIAITALVGSYAAASYVNHLLLVPRFLRNGKYLRHVSSLIGIMMFFTAAALAVLRLFYVKILGPFPVRPWYEDYAIDLFGMVVHVLAAACVVWVFKRLTRSARIAAHNLAPISVVAIRTGLRRAADGTLSLLVTARCRCGRHFGRRLFEFLCVTDVRIVVGELVRFAVDHLRNRGDDLRFVGDVRLLVAECGVVGQPFCEPFLVGDVEPLHELVAGCDLRPIRNCGIRLRNGRSFTANQLR
jgi:hypothetical protein